MRPTDISRSHFSWVKQINDFGSHNTNFGHIQTKRKVLMSNSIILENEE